MKNYLLLITLLTFGHSYASDYLLNTEKKCHGYSSVSVGSRADNCIGLVVDKGEGLSKPRKIVQVSRSKFILTDMVNWNPNRGVLWLLDTSKSQDEGRLTKIFSGLNLPHGLRIGHEGLIYVGEAHQIFRFNLDNPNETKETIISNLPTGGKHPLTEFLITKDNRIIVNVGAPSDQCLDEKGRPIYPCLEAKSEALIREYSIDNEGKVSLLGNLAYGLRNSMGLIENGQGDIIQFNNGMDFSDEDGPNEEINLITKDAHYGWPYCYENGKLNDNYKRTFFNRRVPKIDCSDYANPIGLLPPHSAPLDAQVYDGEMFPELKGKAIVSLHGYKPTGQRVIAVDVEGDENISSFEELVFGWTAVEGIRAKGAPVGLEVGSEGEIYFVDDKNKTVMVLAKGEANTSSGTTIQRVDLSSESVDKFKKVQEQVLKNKCVACHSNFAGEAKEVAKNLVRSGLVKPDPLNSEFYLRMSGESENMAMPPGNNDIITQDDLEVVREWIDSL
ncbi:sorbosone dehydrogenase family protein [Bacteriovorax sp. Seq25_V]|uniref:PQQ-dependent sugar dehydrogenase n=1 Tax=Bacteriovorax sp. Seq25_V TaxID=1201288 RepID=UPI0018DF5793|nr:PQQ-dependent sugar dehydrogenase [Bacteriovorax sp. Seq25_V]